MAKKILVTGGTGTIGRHVVERLLAAGHQVRVAARRAPGRRAEYEPVTADLLTGAGLEAAVKGQEVVVHCVTTHVAKDVPVARNLVEAARRAGAAHLVNISIVGCDRVPFGYYRAQTEVERLFAESGVGWTNLRATQFHDLVYDVCRFLARSPVMLAPSGVDVQPVEAGEVADRLAGLAQGPPQGRVADMGGPRVQAFGDLARAYLAATGRRRPVLGVRVPGRLGAALRRGVHLAPEHAVGTVSFADYLAERTGGAGEVR